MSEVLTRSDWLYTDPTTASESDVQAFDESEDSDTPASDLGDRIVRDALRAKQSARMYYEVAKESPEQQRVLSDYFNRTSSVREIRQEINSMIQENFSERASETESPGGNGLPLAAKALAEDGIIDEELHQLPPSDDYHDIKEIDGTLHWDCGTCDFVAHYVSWNQQQQSDPYVLCPACDQPL